MHLIDEEQFPDDANFQDLAPPLHSHRGGPELHVVESPERTVPMVKSAGQKAFPIPTLRSSARGPQEFFLTIHALHCQILPKFRMRFALFSSSLSVLWRRIQRNSLCRFFIHLESRFHA